MNYIKTYDEFILESLNNKTNDVCLFPGRFQPYHKGHIAAFKEASKRFKCNIIPIQVLAKKNPSPFPDDLSSKMSTAIANEFNFILEPLTYQTGYIPAIYELVKELGYNPIGIACGSDRVKDYERMAKIIEKDFLKDSNNSFKVEMVDERLPGGPSGTKVRIAIKEDNEYDFKKYTPKSIHKYYKEMRKYL